MGRYRGLYTFDNDNHRYVPVSQAYGIIDCSDYDQKEPPIKDEKVRKVLGQVVEMEASINQITREFEAFNKQFKELCGEKKNEN